MIMLRVRYLLAAHARLGCLAVLALSLAMGSASADAPTTTEDLPEVFEKFLPEGVQDLKTIQTHVKKIVDKVMPATVGLQIGPAQGSGVIVDREGHILTAAHVSGEAGRNVVVILPDGKKLKGVTLGANVGIDSGLVKITEPDAKFPFIEMGHSSELKKGNWVIAIGHPGGYQAGRSPVLRVGRVLDANAKVVRTDCTLVGGDSGGPLFDMRGQVIAIHSRIGGSITFNIHVPVDTYVESWDRLASSEVWGSPFNFLTAKNKLTEPFLGVRPDPDAKLFKILSVTANSPADKAGLRTDDVILKIDDREIGSIGDFDAVLRGKAAGNPVTLEIRRGAERLSITVTLGKRPME
jgi:serine protease Do